MQTNLTKEGYSMTTQTNSTEVPEMAFFSDTLRDLLKGNTFSTTEKGFVSGANGKEKTLQKCFMGLSPEWCTTPSQSINYASCHDNLSLMDRIIRSTPEASVEERIRMNNLAAAIYMTAEGVPFMQAGEEFLRSKVKADGGLDENSYASPDSVNSLKWSNLEDEQYQNVYQYYKGLIAFRKAHPVLRLDNAEDVKAHVTLVEDLDDNVVAFAITGDVDGETADGMYVIFNANNEKKEVTLPEGNWNVCINDTLAGTDTIETISGTAEVAPVSALILVKGDGNGSTAVVSAGTFPAWMAYVFTILVAVVIGACSVWSQKKAGKAGRK